MRRTILIGTLLIGATVLSAQPPWGYQGARRSPDRFYDGDIRPVRSLARELEQRTDMFKKQFDHQIDRTRWNETPLEDHLWQQTKRLENAVDGMKSNIEHGRNDDRVRRDLGEALNAANDIDRAMRRIQLGPDAERNWAAIRAGLFEMARYYRVGRY